METHLTNEQLIMRLAEAEAENARLKANHGVSGEGRPESHGSDQTTAQTP